MSVTIDETGATSTTLAETLQELIDIFRSLLGGNIDLEPESPIAQILAVVAYGNTEIQDAVVAVANAHSLNNATGVLLDDLFSFLNVLRSEGQATTVNAALTGTQGTIINPGTRAADTDGNQFQTTEQITLGAGNTNTVIQATLVGNTPIPPAGRMRIVTPIAGLETLNSLGTGRVGRFAQSDIDYRAQGRTLAAQGAVGSMSAMDAGVGSLGVTARRVIENRESALVTVQQWPITPHAVLVLAAGATDAELTRAVENHRSGGQPTISAIRGAERSPANIASLITMTGMIEWDGTQYAVDLTAAADGPGIAAVLSAALPINVIWLRNRLVAVFEWTPDRTKAFGDHALVQLLGLDPDTATGGTGPWVRPTIQDLTVTAAITAFPAFSADGLNQVRAAFARVVNGYGIGAEAWANDLLAAAESIVGTRVTALSVQHNGVDVSGVEPPLDTIWALPSANLTITVTSA